MTNYNYDAINNTLTVTASFLKKAGVFNSSEYNTIKSIRADYPNVEIVKAEVSKKNVKHHIKLAQMVQFITLWDSKNNTTYLDQYETVKALSKIQASPYKYVEDWFKKSFPNWENQIIFNNDGTFNFVTKSEESKEADAPVVNTPAIAPVEAVDAVEKAA